jgi:hypothetical protein
MRVAIDDVCAVVFPALAVVEAFCKQLCVDFHVKEFVGTPLHHLAEGIDRRNRVFLAGER